MDNGGSHKNKLIRTKIEETGNKLRYNVPYKKIQYKNIPKKTSYLNYMNMCMIKNTQESIINILQLLI